MKIINIVGARPNFMKIAPFIKEIDKYNLDHKDAIKHSLVHTGQHYDDRMNKAFFDALDIPPADINLEIGSGTHAEQVGQTMIAFEKVLKTEKPDWVVVVGDVNATLACSVTAKKEHVKVCHIEAGLRSGDLEMPEEINRLVTDRLSDLLLTPDKLSIENLRKEGVSDSKINFVGNIMIDTLEANREKAEQLSLDTIISENLLPKQSPPSLRLSVSPLRYALMTLHRPSNVDDKSIFEPIIRFLLDEVTTDMPLIFPVHPRTQKQLQDFGFWDEVLKNERLILLHPLGYHDMLRLNMDAAIMLTDSGGLQEECTILGTPCLTLRWNTERPITLREHGGASVLVGNNIKRIRDEYQFTLQQECSPLRPDLWDGKTANRCLYAIIDYDKKDNT
ncbi:MAG: UDP-N-acetylglucosamine 2-epimerase (non-hydrolyzing) [Candidatus Marinimicrobia bacterium]|nr:UDP-N-acetylglucosamine 2-epimerase (non-hydrolyzing) [Candidatus Neomarinimicrobiota bacterium]